MNESDKIFVAGHLGMLGSAMMRRLQAEGFSNIVTRDRSDLDLADDGAVAKFFRQERASHSIVAAARVGGIKANNDLPVEFLLDNLADSEQCHSGSPRESASGNCSFLEAPAFIRSLRRNRFRKHALLSGPLEPTNEAYAIAKIAGNQALPGVSREYGANFISAMPTNLYGPNDNFDLETSHVLPALMRKAHEAKDGRTES